MKHEVYKGMETVNLEHDSSDLALLLGVLWRMRLTR
jgi:hypothetical protein